MDTEHAYIHVNALKVWGIEPKNVIEFSLSEDYYVILDRLIGDGWELVNPAFQPPPVGQSLVHVKRRTLYAVPPSSPEFEYFVVMLEPPESREEVQHRFEVKGCDLWRVLQPMNDHRLHLIFKRPKTAPSM